MEMLTKFFGDVGRIADALEKIALVPTAIVETADLTPEAPAKSRGKKKYPVAPAKTEEAVREAPVEKPVIPEAAPEASVDEDIFGEEPAPETHVPTIEDVQNAAKGFVAVHGADKAREIVRSFGVAKIPEMTDKQRIDCMAAFLKGG